MDHTMKRPWWVMTNGRDDSRGRHGERRGRGPGPGLVRDGGEGPGGFGPFGPMGLGGPRPRLRHRARRGDVRAAILALLEEQPMNGYQIMQALSERTNGGWRPSPGAVYPALSQLTDEGLVTALEEDGQRLHRLTQAGREAASGIPDKPWDAVNRTSQAATSEATHALWHEYNQLGLAARAVMDADDPDTTEQATRLVQQARRGLYGLLAGDPGPTD